MRDARETASLDALLPPAIGGTGLVGLVYWFVYLRPRGAARHSVAQDATAAEPGRR